MYEWSNGQWIRSKGVELKCKNPWVYSNAFSFYTICITMVHVCQKSHLVKRVRRLEWQKMLILAISEIMDIFGLSARRWHSTPFLLREQPRPTQEGWKRTRERCSSRSSVKHMGRLKLHNCIIARAMARCLEWTIRLVRFGYDFVSSGMVYYTIPLWENNVVKWNYS